MKVQLKLKNEVYENYLIDENGVIYDLNGNIQETYQHRNRPIFKKVAIHTYVMHSFVGYKEGMDVHHINENKQDNRLCNLVYLSRSEHTALHFKGKSSWIKGKKHSQETKIKISQSQSGNTNVRGRVWINNGKVNKFVYPDQIPDGFVRGRI